MGVRMGQRRWRYGNGGIDLKCICIYCMYRCVRERRVVFCLLVARWTRAPADGEDAAWGGGQHGKRTGAKSCT
ncbi:hypothetical protein Hdeb2414_s0013g00406111 [Helianthus debilis subsp. tardiflorus]